MTRHRESCRRRPGGRAAPVVWFVLSLCVAPAAAQAGLGGTPVAPQWQRWLVGGPVAVAGDDAAPCTVWAFCSQVPSLFAADADYLAELRGRFGPRGLQVVASVGQAEPAARERWRDCAVVLDRDARTEMAWTVVNRESRANVLVTDRDGRVAFVGRPGAGLVDAVERVLEGEVDIGREASARAARMHVPDGFDDAVAAPTVARLEPLVEYAPRDGLLQGLLYLTLANKAVDADGAAAVRRRAVAALAAEARPLGVFADLVLRGDPQQPELVAALRPRLVAATERTPTDPVVLLACLRAHVLAGDGRAAGRLAMRMRRHVVATARDALDFATLLATDETPEVWRDLAAMSLDRAAALGADERLLAAARYVVRLRCARDPEGAEAVLDGYLRDLDRSEINNDAWYFLTQLDTMGRFDWFAVAMVERLLDRQDEMPYFEFDTAALAMFRVGRRARAVELQRAAIEGGGDTPDYRQRLERYERAAGR